MAEKYTVSNITIETLLGYIKSGEIAIPEIQSVVKFVGIKMAFKQI